MEPRTLEQPWQDLDLVRDAMAMALEVHRLHVRKGTAVPYVSHLWSVAALALEHGADDAQVAAALLHDAVEDGGGPDALQRIADLDAEVARLVEHLSDSVADTTAGESKPPWFPRKVAYVRSLAEADGRVLLVSACDKLHNARCILADHRALGPALWDRFSVDDPACHAWYYGALVEAFAGRVPPALEDELRRTVGELHQRLRDGEAPDLDARLATIRADAAAR